eukprot:m51a1_g271 putative beta-glucosidase (488) ;mRNA; f:252995-254908
MTRVALLLVLAAAAIASGAFPPGFVWGTATAAYQIEGSVDVDGRGPSIWDAFSRLPGKTVGGATGDVADDSYVRFEEDTEMLARMGVHWYRFSIAWSRVLPRGNGAVNEAGLRHYSRVVDALLARNITPFVTLYHWDLPQALDEGGRHGWLDRSIVGSFARYADVVFDALGDRVKHWITFNEPHEVTWAGYGAGEKAPGRCSDRRRCAEGNSTTEPYIAAHHLLLAHAAAVEIYRAKYQPHQGGVIGMTVNCDHAEPYSDSPADVAAAARYYDFQMGQFAHPLYFGDYPASMRRLVGDRLPRFTCAQRDSLLRSHDFFGLNTYTSKYAQDRPDAPALGGWEVDMHTTIRADRDGALIGPQADSSWLNVVPWGIQRVLRHIKETYGNPPVYITENGVSVPGEDAMPLQQALADTFRVNFIRDYLSFVEKAIVDDHCDVKGYFVWSLMDNFEWADGYTKRFGIHYVDYKNNCTRYPKDSARWFADFIKQ